VSQGLVKRDASTVTNRSDRILEADLLLFGELGWLVDRDEHVAALFQGFELFGNGGGSCVLSFEFELAAP